jgi:hypothetical protein
MKHGQTKGYDHVLRCRQNILEDVPRRSVSRCRMECIFATVAGNTQLRQTQYSRPLVARRFDRREDALFISVPIKRCLIENTQQRL